MDNFVVSALKYRPQTFKDVVGQSAITTTLEKAIENNHLAQALLFTGPRGVGKTSCARILAKLINSKGSVEANQDYAFNIFELDAASNNSVDDIRNLTDQVRIPPQVGTYKVYIIDEAHMLSTNAFNAFLKTLEEPPKHCIFILATTEKHKIIPTILSRCQIFDFKRITVSDAKNYLKLIAKEQGIDADEDALHIIAQKSDGAMRDALSIFDRVVSFSGDKLTRKAVSENLNVLDHDVFFEATNLILNNQIPALLLLFDSILNKGFEGQHFITGLASHFRDLFVALTPETLSLLESSNAINEKYKVQASKTDSNFLSNALALTNECDLNYRVSRNQRLLVELCLMKLASVNFDEKKKKTTEFIIPAAHFNRNTEMTTSAKFQAAVTSDKSHSSKLSSENLNGPQIDTTATVVENSIKSSFPVSQGQASGLSLKSIQRKKDHQIKKMEVTVDRNELPKDVFSQEQLIASWDAFVNTLEEKGRYNLAAILKIDNPKIKDDNLIALEFPNSSNKIEVERQKIELLQFIRKELNNFDIELDITVNETMDKQFVYTAVEKYAKLKEKNPAIESLKKSFNLEI